MRSDGLDSFCFTFLVGLSTQTIDELEQLSLGDWDVGLLDGDVLLLGTCLFDDGVTGCRCIGICAGVALAATALNEITAHYLCSFDVRKIDTVLHVSFSTFE